MNVRNVIAAIEVVVDEHLPVAVERVVPTLHPVQRFEAARREVTREVGSEESAQAADLTFEPDPPTSPPRRSRRARAHATHVEIAHVGEIGCSFQRAVEGVGPSVIGTPELLRRTALSVTTAAAW